VKAHISQVLRWSGEEEAGLAEALAAAFGMGVPILLAGIAGALPVGIAAALGSMAVSGAIRGGTTRERWLAFRLAFVPVLLGAATGVALAGHGVLTSALTVGLIGAVALASGYSRPLAVATTRFTLFLLMTLGFAGGEGLHAAVLLPITAGALWTALLGLLFAAIAGVVRAPATGAAVPAAAGPTAAQKFRRWRSTLRQAAGWQYALRLSLALTAAMALGAAWPSHHLAWIAMTVALLTQRQPEPFSAKSTQRIGGTVLGVAIAALLAGHHPGLWALALGAGLLASVRPMLRTRNYLAYSAAMTPLIMIILDARAPLGSSLLLDRIGATLAGAALVLLADLVAVKVLARTGSTGSTGAPATANRTDRPA